MSRSIRRAMIDRDHQQLSLVRQCILLDVSRASVYYRPVPTRAEDLELMALMDRQYLKTPFYGSRKMKAWLLQQSYLVSRKRVRRLMRLMGLEAIYRRPNTSKPAPGHRIFPYLLKGVEVNRVDQVWAADITYIGSFHQGPFPGVNLTGMDLKSAGQLGDGLFPRKGGQGHLGLERRTVLIPRLLHVLLLHVG